MPEYSLLSLIVSSQVQIDNGVKIHIGCQIHHEVKIGKYSTISPASIILGNVKIGNYSFIGANSTIKQGVKIGNNCTIGAGSVVVKDVDDGDTVVGNPARIKGNVSDEMVKWKSKGTELYQKLPQECKDLMKECDPLEKIEENRKIKQKITLKTWKKTN